MLFAALKDKKKLSGWYEGKSAFQTITTEFELYKQQQQQQKTTNNT